jgi:predicted ABC-type ATPase
MKDIIILGGPNGAGKTTAARVLLPKTLGLLEFVNADEIARGLSPFNVDSVALKAGRLMLERIDELVLAGTSFAFETTCAGKGHAKWLKQCQAKGWRVHMLFLWLPDFRMAQRRVVQRVSEGGHSIPPEVVERRYRAGIVKMRDLYLPLADTAAIYDNSNEARTLIAERESGKPFCVRDRPRWALIEEMKS